MDNLAKIREFVGDVSKEQLRHIDSFVGENIGVFMPISGQCYYAITPNHTHPSYMFVIPFNDQTVLVMDDKKVNPKQWSLYALAPEIEHHEDYLEDIPRYMAIFIEKKMLERELSVYDNDLEFKGEIVGLADGLFERIKSLSEVLEFANNNPASYIATADGKQPRVRAFLMWFADESGFYYHTGAVKKVCKQLKENSNVEICFHDQTAEDGKMLRVTGEVEFIEDEELRNRLVEERPFLKAATIEFGDEILQVFRISTGEAHFWTMADNLREDKIEIVQF